MTEIAPIAPSKPTYNLTDRQKSVLAYICHHINTHEQSPTVTEIAAGLEPPCTKQSAGELVAILEERGFISRSKNHRSIVVL